MNAFIQTWFFDRAFRSGVYGIRVSAEMSPIYQLQRLFASLERSRESVYNPRLLVESMGLRESEQQDANE